MHLGLPTSASTRHLRGEVVEHCELLLLLIFSKPNRDAQQKGYYCDQPYNDSTMIKLGHDEPPSAWTVCGRTTPVRPTTVGFLYDFLVKDDLVMEYLPLHVCG